MRKRKRARERMEKRVHKELVGEKTILISELYKAVDEKGNVDNFVDVLEQECRQRKLNLSDIFAIYNSHLYGQIKSQIEPFNHPYINLRTY